MQLMARYPDNYFELAIIDPPYGIGAANKTTIGKRKNSCVVTKYKKKNWDSVIPPAEYFSELFRVSKNQIIFGANYFTHFLPPSMGWFVYDKRQPENFSMAHAELAFTSFNRAVRMKGFKRNEVQNCVSNNKKIALVNAKIHPTQKPVALYKWLLTNYAKEGDKILDTHLGSFSSVIACLDMGFEITGCELDKEYFENGMKRVNTFKQQLKLF